jgi:hypothetical protein
MGKLGSRVTLFVDETLHARRPFGREAKRVIGRGVGEA